MEKNKHKYYKNVYFINERNKCKMEENISFEEIIKQLEQIAQELEKGDLNLDESVAKFEQGMKLSKKCNTILENAEKRINMLIRNDSDVTEESFTVQE